MVGLSWLNVLAGIWLVIAPWVLAYQTTAPKVNDVVVGVVVAVTALLVATGEPRTAS